MAKRRSKRTSKRKQKDWLVSQKQVNHWLNQATDQIMQGNYDGVIKICRRVLRYAPPQSSERGEALEHLATAYTMQKQFEVAYQTLSQALEINPHHAYVWYNRGLAGRYTLRLVQAIHDFEKAVELEKDPVVRGKYTEVLVQTREVAEKERAMRGPDFTLEQLRQQQELFQQGLQMMQREKWPEAEQTFRRVIDMGDCLPQPHGNLGLSLIMQKKYDEAEAAFKRALDVDPNYDLAKNNLVALPNIRKSGQPPKFFIRDPFAKAKVSLTMQMVDED